ncbi:primosomal protein N' [Xylanibacillus composti]|uniref:Replication restart protein PriA n=1 Tax=Xylanibacillus composti TaxID=1572762 RepID=A0A8J4M1C1_9BACL|nr:primosomal protein N' [Xylanibacillus composti]MDT9725594.1 primosomal protein N' [Xylanibacillus composti]GIQ67687.1 primosomal protein N' [Xylanibacillus composti]
MIANVIVDVPAKQTDRPFDYRIPPLLADWVEVGSRVAVPFGNRLLQGFVVGMADVSEMNPAKLKEIGSVLDPAPPLTSELVKLGIWMGREYVCPSLLALQSMLPGALKAKYKRLAVLPDELDEDARGRMQQEDSGLYACIARKGYYDLLSLIEQFPASSAVLKRWMKLGWLEEQQTVSDRLRKKKQLAVYPTDVPLSPEALAQLARRAPRQLEVLDYLRDSSGPVLLSELIAALGISAGTVKGLADKGMLVIKQAEIWRDPYAGRQFKASHRLQLTSEQQAAYDTIKHAVQSGDAHRFLLHGVTGSGKTEIYLQTIEDCLSMGKEAIVLVPEISLTPQMVERFKSRFGDLVAVLHSRLSQGERYDEWRKIRYGTAQVAVGARSAVFAPFTRLGLIIIDEEHESSYKQEESPKYHAREVAVQRALHHGAVVVLGSATPSIETYAAALQHEQREAAASAAGERSERTLPSGSTPPLRLLTLKRRVMDRPLPQIHVVDMREELREGNRMMFSRRLYEGIAKRLERREQMVLLLNRRGYSTFVMCRSCGYVVQCPHCDISLTYHRRAGQIRCHYCGYTEKEPGECPGCQSRHIRFFGTGTQKVEEELYKHFPDIRVIRMDVDTTGEKGSHEKWLNLFREKEADVLLGTQMVAKGLDFPDVTLVGVIAADTVLNLPDFRSAEKTFQLLTQVAGRAGRHELPGEVVIQTYHPDHYSVEMAAKHDYSAFFAREMRHRQSGLYPPYSRLALITFSHPDIPVLLQTGERLIHALAEQGVSEVRTSGRVEVLGPVASSIPRIKDRYRFQCMLKYRHEPRIPEKIRAATDSLDEWLKKHQVQLSTDMNPQVML